MKKIVLKPLSSTTLACVGRLSKKMEELFQEIEEAGKIKSGENLASMLKDVFSERVDGFGSLDLNERLLALTQHSIKSAFVYARILGQNLKGEITSEVKSLLEKSGLFSVFVA